MHVLDARRLFELATRIKEVVAKEKCPRDSYDFSDATICVNDVSIQLQSAWNTVQTNCSVVHKVEDDYMYLDRQICLRDFYFICLPHWLCVFEGCHLACRKKKLHYKL